MKLLVNQIHKLLIKKQKTIATAESCTGGLLAKLLTEVAGSSHYYLLGMITYSNKAKQALLKIPAGVIKRDGAVSKPVAILMAQQIRKIAHADFGVGITGIAGPGGGSRQKPVGTVLVAVSTNTNTVCKKFYFNGSRSAVRKKAVIASLTILKALLR